MTPKRDEGKGAATARVALVALIALAAVGWLVTFLRRQVYSDGVETSIARMVEALARGEALYEPFGSRGSWVNDTYPPLYLWLATAANRVVGDAILATRVVSLMAGAVIAVIVLRRARDASRDVTLSLVALLLSFPFLRWSVAARSDLLAIAFLAGALALLFARVDRPTAWRAYLAGALIGCALGTKQSLMGFPLGIALAFLWRRRGDAIRMGVGAAVALGALLSLYRAIYPDVLFHILVGGKDRFTLEFGLKVAGAALPVAVPFAIAWWRSPPAEVEDDRRELLPALFAGTLGWAVFASFKSGADSNYFLELYLVLAVGCALRHVRVPLWGLVVALCVTAINVGGEMREVARRERSRRSVLAILDRVTGGDRNYFASQHSMLINIPLDVGLQFPPARMDYYMAALEEQGRLSLVPLREQFCAAQPRLLVSRYALGEKPDYRRHYLGGSIPSMVTCTTYAYRCEAHWLYSDAPLPIDAADGCQPLSR